MLVLCAFMCGGRFALQEAGSPTAGRSVCGCSHQNGSRSSWRVVGALLIVPRSSGEAVWPRLIQLIAGVVLLRDPAPALGPVEPEADEMARRKKREGQSLHKVLGVPALFSTAYGNVGSSIYYALGVVAPVALASRRSSSCSPACSS